MIIKPHDYTTVDYSGYYKDWDSSMWLGTKINYTFMSPDSKKYELIYAVPNHELAIEWTKHLHSDITAGKKPIINNGIYGFADPMRDCVVTTQAWCFSRPVRGHTLEVQILNISNQPLEDMYLIANNKLFTTNVKLVSHDESDTIDFNDVPRVYNKKVQDRELLVEVPPEQYEIINSERVIVGTLNMIKIDGEIQGNIENRMLDINPPVIDVDKGWKLVSIDIGSYKMPWELTLV